MSVTFSDRLRISTPSWNTMNLTHFVAVLDNTVTRSGTGLCRLLVCAYTWVLLVHAHAPTNVGGVCVCVCVCVRERERERELCYGSPRRGELRTQKFKSHLRRTNSLNVLPLKAWSRSVYCHTCYAYCQGFLANFYPSGLFACIF